MDTWQWFNQIITDRYPDAYQATRLYDEDGIPAGPFVFLLIVALTKDGKWLQFAQTQPRLFKAFLIELGLDHLPADPKWAGLPVLEDPALRLELWELMLTKVRERTLAEWQEVFEKNLDVYAEQYAAGSGILDHPQVVFDGRITEIVDPKFGPLRQPREIAVFHQFATPELRPAPALAAAAPTPAPASVAWAEPSPLANPSRALPLEGLTIVELGFMFAGPYATTLLTDLGARVIKIEPLEGDEIRRLQPFPETGGAKVMQGKESITLDITTADGNTAALKLLASADIVLDAYRAGVADRIGVGEKAVRAINPSVVFIHAPGYGTGGPCGHRPAYAPSIGAAGGFARANLGPLFRDGADLDLADVKEGAIQLSYGSMRTCAQPDGITAVTVATTMLLGLYARARSDNAGQEISTSMLTSAMHVVPSEFLDTVEGSGPIDDHTDASQLGLGALYRLYETADGWVFLAAPKDNEWAAFVGATAEWADLNTPEFSSAAARAEHSDTLAKELESMFRTRTAAEWEQHLTAHDVGCAEVSTEETPAILMSHLGRESGYVTDVVHPLYDAHPRLAPLTRFSRSATTAKPACLAGQHTDALLTEFGYSTEQIEDMRQRSIIN